jgi:ABC-2 type transport system permease protein
MNGNRSGADVGLWEAIKLVAGREIRVRLRDKAFLIAAISMLLLVAISTILPVILESGPTTVAAVESTAPAARAAGAEVTVVADVAAVEQLVLDDTVEAALIPDPSAPSGVAVVAKEDAPNDLVAALSVQPKVQLLKPSDVDQGLAFLIPFAFAILFFMTSVTFGYSIAQSVVEEKQTRIVEILVAAIPVRALLAGKVLGSTVLAFGQILLIVGVAIAGMTIAGSDLMSAEALRALGSAMVWFLPFFVFGFLMLAGLWAVSGALVSRLEDLGSTTAPVQMLIMFPFFGVIWGSSNAGFLTAMSYVPFSAPIAMPVRIFQRSAAWWEPPLAMGITFATAAALGVFAARLYEGSLLRTNGRTSVKQAWRSSELAGR